MEAPHCLCPPCCWPSSSPSSRWPTCSTPGPSPSPSSPGCSSPPTPPQRHPQCFRSQIGPILQFLKHVFWTRNRFCRLYVTSPTDIWHLSTLCTLCMCSKHARTEASTLYTYLQIGKYWCFFCLSTAQKCNGMCYNSIKDVFHALYLLQARCSSKLKIIVIFQKCNFFLVGARTKTKPVLDRYLWVL